MSLDTAVALVASPSLRLYLVLHKDDAETAVRTGFVAARHVTPKWDVIGLRQNPEEARKRYLKVFGETADASLVLLECFFSAAGIVRFTLELTDAAHDFLPRLHKVQFANQAEDWGVWHFVGDLPLAIPEVMTYNMNFLVSS